MRQGISVTAFCCFLRLTETTRRPIIRSCESMPSPPKGSSAGLDVYRFRLVRSAFQLEFVVQGEHELRDQFHRGVQVFERDHFVGRMHVAVRNADHGHRGTAFEVVDGVGVCSGAARGDLDLDGKLVFLSHIQQPRMHSRMHGSGDGVVSPLQTNQVNTAGHAFQSLGRKLKDLLPRLPGELAGKHYLSPDVVNAVTQIPWRK